MCSNRHMKPAGGNETQKWTGGIFHCQNTVSNGVVIDNGEFESRFLNSKARHWSELSQRSPASNGGAVSFISISDAVVQRARGWRFNSCSSKKQHSKFSRNYTHYLLHINIATFCHTEFGTAPTTNSDLIPKTMNPNWFIFFQIT
jgi:hypothetical protein